MLWGRIYKTGFEEIINYMCYPLKIIADKTSSWVIKALEDLKSDR